MWFSKTFQWKRSLLEFWFNFQGQKTEFRRKKKITTIGVKCVMKSWSREAEMKGLGEILWTQGEVSSTHNTPPPVPPPHSSHPSTSHPAVLHGSSPPLPPSLGLRTRPRHLLLWRPSCRSTVPSLQRHLQLHVLTRPPACQVNHGTVRLHTRGKRRAATDQPGRGKKKKKFQHVLHIL